MIKCLIFIFHTYYPSNIPNTYGSAQKAYKFKKNIQKCKFHYFMRFDPDLPFHTTNIESSQAKYNGTLKTEQSINQANHCILNRSICCTQCIGKESTNTIPNEMLLEIHNLLLPWRRQLGLTLSHIR